MAPAYKVIYFDVNALGEPIRFLLSYGGLEFEDNRFSDESWPSIKPNMPFGQVPVLEHKGKTAFQSIAICRYLAKQVKLVGKDDWEDLEIDAIVDTISDMRGEIALYSYEENKSIKDAKAGPLFNETLPFYLGKLDSLAKKNNGYLVLGRLTWADVYFVAILDYLNSMTKKELITNYANLRTVKANVEASPNVKAWIAKRPKSI